MIVSDVMWWASHPGRLDVSTGSATNFLWTLGKTLFLSDPRFLICKTIMMMMIIVITIATTVIRLISYSYLDLMKKMMVVTMLTLGMFNDPMLSLFPSPKLLLIGCAV